MTVCIAAICNEATSEGPSIICASDRLLTAGNIQFEPQQMKINMMTNSIAALVAGEADLLVEILGKVQTDIQRRVESEPGNWWLVEDVVALYQRYYSETRFKRAENQYLSPLGLNGDSFIQNQQRMDPQLVNRLASELLEYDTPRIQTIIAGIDPTGPKIFVTDNIKASNKYGVGFAAIGIGASHANSQFMFAGYTRRSLMPEVVLLTYSAKKRAEVAPGVGEATDMIVIGPLLGKHVLIGPHVHSKLNEIYRGCQAANRQAEVQARLKMNKYVEELMINSQVNGQPGQQSENVTLPSIENQPKSPDPL